MQITFLITPLNKILKKIITFTFMHLADAFIQSDLQCIQAIHFFISMRVPELNPQPLLYHWTFQNKL